MEVAVTGASGRLGSRVIAGLRAAGHEVTALDKAGGSGVRRIDLVDGDVKDALAEAEVVVHLASAFDGRRDADESADIDLEVTRRLLDACAAIEVRRLVLLSSAMVYGAWPTNPVPLTEAAPLRPNPECAFAVAKAAQEQLAEAWQRDTGAELVVLRPTTAGAEGRVSWVAQAIRAAAALGVEGEEPPVQYVHLDDLAAAVVDAVEGQLRGAYNVAPDDWVDADLARSLEGAPPRLHVSEQTAGKVASFRWRYRLAPTPPGLVPYTMHPWVVANGRLTATGWVPSYTTEQTIVDTFPARPWAMVTSRRRQQLALGGLATVVAGAATGAAVLARRFRR